MCGAYNIFFEWVAKTIPAQKNAVICSDIAQTHNQLMKSKSNAGNL